MPIRVRNRNSQLCVTDSNLEVGAMSKSKSKIVLDKKGKHLILVSSDYSEGKKNGNKGRSSAQGSRMKSRQRVGGQSLGELQSRSKFYPNRL